MGKKCGVCFYGAGVILRKLLTVLEDTEIGKNTRAIVDRSIELHGQIFEYGNISIPIISPEDFYKNYNKMILIISSTYAWDIYNSLNGIGALGQTICCCYNTLFRRAVVEREKAREYPKQIRLLDEPAIPQKIHYCWFGNGEMPEDNKKCIESWHKYCPEYEIIRWDENNYDVSWNRYIREAYEMKEWAFVSDVARLDIIYREGGIYLDTDVEVIRSLEDLRYQYCFFGVESAIECCTVSSGLGFGAITGSKEIKNLLKLYNNIRFIKDDKKLDLTTCPTRQTPYFIDRGWNGNGDYYSDKTLTIYPMYVLSGSDMNTGLIYKNEYTYTIHHYGMSWISEEKKKRIAGLQLLAQKAKQMTY